MVTLLDSILLPDAIRTLRNDQLRQLADEIRQRIIETVSRNGGHLAANLGVVELTIALLANLELPRDKIIWDVGHQCYPYKLLTDRRDRFETLRKLDGIAGFPRREESIYDAFGTGHATTSISAALGLAQARDLRQETQRVIAVIGDGALTGGIAWEALNIAGDTGTDLLVVLNDNEMSIGPNVGALATHIGHLRTLPLYQRVEDGARRIMDHLPVGRQFLAKTGDALKHGVTNWVSPPSGIIFESMGFSYLGPIDGHDLPLLRSFFRRACTLRGPVLVHVITKKGKGYEHAESDARNFHGVGPFNISNGKVERSDGKTYTQVFGETMVRLGREDPRIVAITAAMPDGTGLNSFAQTFPTRFFNVGIAEEHAVIFAGGLAAGGMRPVVAIYSTFLQRAYDQIIHDICLQKLPVIFALDRGGIVGEDGPTHQGLFDISYLRHIPNLVVMIPKDENELRWMLYTALQLDQPVAIRYPRDKTLGLQLDGLHELEVGRAEILREGGDLAIIAVGPLVHTAMNVAEKLASEGCEATVVNARYVKPLDTKLLHQLARRVGRLVTVEENVLQGGFGSAVREALYDTHESMVPILGLGLPDSFIEHGSAKQLRAKYGLDEAGITSSIRRWMEACIPSEKQRSSPKNGKAYEREMRSGHSTPQG